jgi:hypothetical protein
MDFGRKRIALTRFDFPFQLCCSIFSDGHLCSERHPAPRDTVDLWVGLEKYHQQLIMSDGCGDVLVELMLFKPLPVWLRRLVNDCAH